MGTGRNNGNSRTPGFGNVYAPREDSFLLRDAIKSHAKGRVLDMGTGSGILAKEAAEYADEVIAVDINHRAIEEARLAIPSRKIRFRVSDLFSGVSGKFDLIIFNPPYLPNHPKLKDAALDGGKKGYELVQRFLENAGEHLNRNGKILLLISSFTKKASVERIIRKNGFAFEIASEKKLDFEKLYVYLLKKESRGTKATEAGKTAKRPGK